MAMLCLRIIASSQAVELTQSISKVMLKLSFSGSFGSPTTMSVGRVVEFNFLQCVRAE
jgi:hypothetical protein